MRATAHHYFALALALALALGLSTLLRPSAGRANIAAAQPDPALLGELGLVAGGLRVTGEELTLSCAERRGRPVCDLLARYQLHNPSPRAQTLVAAFYGVYTENVRIVVDGRPAAAALTTEQIAALDARVEGVQHEQAGRGSWRLGRGPRPELVRTGFALRARPGQRLGVVVTGRMHPGRFFVPSYARPAVSTRHIWLGSAPGSTDFNFTYLVAPIRTWGPAPPIRLRLRYPSAWKLSGTLAGARGVTPLAAGRRQGDLTEIRATIDGQAVDSVDFSVTLPPPHLFHGGPLLGLGGTLDDSRRLRVRLGYEVAAPAWLFHNLNIETDFDQELLLVPTMHATTAGVFSVIPSLSVGLGLPIRVHSRPTAGVRLELTVQWPVLGLVATFDIFPGVDTAAAEFFQAGLLAQIGL